jgi:uncharacterized membrane protein YidH (DUF202 family)
MNLLAHAKAFFVFSGLLLLGIGAVQLLSRPRGRERTKGRVPLNAATIRAVFFLVIGLVVLLLGANVLPMPGSK